MRSLCLPRSFILAILLPILPGCWSPVEDSDREAASGPDESEVVARIDDEPITETDLDAQIQAMAARGDSPRRERALEELIDLRLLERRAEARKIHRQPELAAEIRRQRAMVLADHLIRAEVDSLDIDEDVLRADYEDYVANAGRRREYNARHILVDEREQALALIGEIEDGGDFAELAREHSIGPSSDRGGDLDWFREDEVVPPFAEAVTDLEPEEYTQNPVETRFGWHVILLQDIRETEPRPFDEMRETLRQERVKRHIESFVRELRADSDIEIE